MARLKYGTSFERLNRLKKQWAKQDKAWEDYLCDDMMQSLDRHLFTTYGY